MKYYIKQKVFSIKDRFNIMDVEGNVLYTCVGEIWTFGKKLHLLDTNETEVAFIHQKLLSWLPKFFISRNGIDEATVRRTLTFIKPRYLIEGYGWEVQGDFWSHEYRITKDGAPIASITKKWISWGDSYEIDVADNADAVAVLCAVLIIDAVLAQEVAISSNSGGN